MRSLKTLIFATVVALSGIISVSVPAQEAQVYSQAELDQMLAPIALYPDTVLSHVLIAATYPLEIVQAARWSRNNPGYSGQTAVDMVENQDWDPSVKALVAFPELLDRMDRDIAWTQSLGDAFLAQEGEVTDSIQYLRNQAYNNNQLKSNQQVNVVRETRYIYIEPAQPQVVYVPYYDPRVVYGHWRWASYPPVYWHHPPGFSINLGFYWGTGFSIRSSFFFSSFYWPSRHVVVVDHHYHNRYRHHGYKKGYGGYRPAYHMAHYDGSRRWKHHSEHRRGVAYRGHVSQDRFSKRDGGGNRNYSAPVRTAQVRENQRNWADRQRTRLADSADTPLRADRSSERSGADRSRERNRAGDSGRSIVRNDARPGQRAGTADGARAGTRAETRAGTRDGTRNSGRTAPGTGRDADTVADNTARDGVQRGGNSTARNSNAGRRPAPLDSARGNQRATPGRAAERAGAARTAGRTAPERSAERTRELLADSSKARRSNTQPITPRSAPRNNLAETNRSGRSAAASRQAETQRQAQPQRQVTPQRQAQPQRQAAPQRQAQPQRQAAPQRQAQPQRQAAPQRQAQPQRQAAPQRQAQPQRQATPQRQAAPQRQAKVERAANSQRSEPRQAAGKSQSSNQSRGSRGRDRN